MGRKRLSAAEKLTHTVKFMVTEGRNNLYTFVAMQRGFATVSAWIRSLIDRDIKALEKEGRVQK